MIDKEEEIHFMKLKPILVNKDIKFNNHKNNNSNNSSQNNSIERISSNISKPNYTKVKSRLFKNSFLQSSKANAKDISNTKEIINKMKEEQKKIMMSKSIIINKEKAIASSKIHKRNLYTKLDDILDFKKEKKKSQEERNSDYQNFGQAIKDNLEKFNNEYIYNIKDDIYSTQKRNNRIRNGSNDYNEYNSRKHINFNKYNALNAYNNQFSNIDSKLNNTARTHKSKKTILYKNRSFVVDAHSTKKQFIDSVIHSLEKNMKNPESYISSVMSSIQINNNINLYDSYGKQDNRIIMGNIKLEKLNKTHFTNLSNINTTDNRSSMRENTLKILSSKRHTLRNENNHSSSNKLNISVSSFNNNKQILNNINNKTIRTKKTTFKSEKMINNNQVMSELNNTFNTINNDSTISQNINTQNNKNYTYSKFNKNTNLTLIKKLRDVLVNSLGYLFQNNIHVQQFTTINPFPKYPYSREKSLLFFECIKINDVKGINHLIRQDRLILFDIDYFGQTGYHWAAKRNHLECLRELISWGKHINLYDFKNRTPLFLASMNNNADCVKTLLDNDANPFMKNVDGQCPMDVTTDPSVKNLLFECCESKNYLNHKNFFRQRVLKFHKEVISSYFLEEYKKKFEYIKVDRMLK